MFTLFVHYLSLIFYLDCAVPFYSSKMNVRLLGKFYSFSIIVAFFPALLFGSHDYRQEIPVKMLNVRSLATRYPASNSEFRTSIENGYVIWNSFIQNILLLPNLIYVFHTYLAFILFLIIF